MRKLWGGAFAETNDALVERFGQSIRSDLQFWQEDLIGSVAHARMLGETGIISMEDSLAIRAGLEKIHDMGPESLTQDVEDVHTARSRNDQVATDGRLFLQNGLQKVIDLIKELQGELLDQGELYRDSIMPGYTHGQRAQPITLGFHLMAHFWALQRDGWRAERLFEMVNYSPLGAGALAGTGFPIDREMTSKELGFTAPIPNALDAVSDRGFLLDALHVCSQIMIDLSRMSQELVLFTGREYAFVTLSDTVTTGSSIMPQKRNPDMAELIRGRAARTLANWMTVSTMLKGLTLGYNRDTQEDKPALFDSFGKVKDSLSLMTLMLQQATWHTDRMAEAVRGDFSTATDLADFLAARGMPFREAHEVVGNVVRACIEQGITLEDLDEGILREIAPQVPPEALEVLTPEGSVRRRESQGGPGPRAMAEQIRLARELYERRGFERIA